MAFLSGVFKLHNLSKSRREILDFIFGEYTQVVADMLLWSKMNIETIRANGKYQDKKFTDKSIRMCLPKLADIEAEMASCLKDALLANIAMMLASYLALAESEKQDAGFPISREPNPEDGYLEALHDFVTIGNDLAAETAARNRLMRVARGGVMPIHFCRSQDFAILWDSEKDRFFLWLKLLPRGYNDNRTTITEGNLININTGDIFKYNGSSALLFPLEIGKRQREWHWQYRRFIEPVISGNGSLKSAKLVKNNGEYFIHISFDIDVPEPYEPESYLGVNRGIIHSLGYGIIDTAGAIIATGHSRDPFFEIKQRAMKRVQQKQKRFAKLTKKDYHKQELENIIHQTVNYLLDLAVQHRACLVLEDWKLDNVGKFYRSAYNKFTDCIEYKAEQRGVPIFKRKMWSAYASQICIHCGRDVERADRITTCLECGAQEHADELNGVNLARRVLYKKADWGGAKDKPGDWAAFHRSFANTPDFRTKTDLRILRKAGYNVSVQNTI